MSSFNSFTNKKGCINVLIIYIRIVYKELFRHREQSQNDSCKQIGNNNVLNRQHFLSTPHILYDNYVLATLPILINVVPQDDNEHGGSGKVHQCCARGV